MAEKFMNPSDFEDLSMLSSNAVLEILSEIGCMDYISSFRENKITGYDLCLMNSEILKNDLKVLNFHDRNEILKFRDKSLLKQCKMIIKFS